MNSMSTIDVRYWSKQQQNQHDCLCVKKLPDASVNIDEWVYRKKEKYSFSMQQVQLKSIENDRTLYV